MKIFIKKPQSKDWEIIQRINNYVFLADKDNVEELDMNWPFSKRGIKYYKDLASGKYGYCLIAYSGKKPVGYIALAEKKRSDLKVKIIEIQNIGVLPKYRSRGVGQMLMSEAMKWAKTKKADRLFVESFWGNTKAINFYEKSGFQKFGLELIKKI